MWGEAKKETGAARRPEANLPDPYTREIERLQRLLDDHLRRIERPRILEAGCGSSSYLHFSTDAHVVGVDISAEQLDRNAVLHEKIRADLQDRPLPVNDFDVTICWDVLEHLPRPVAALENIFGSTRQNGLVILGGPNLFSLKGLATKLTPHWFHVWVYRRFLGHPHAGTRDHGPFPTPFRLATSPGSIARLAKSRGFDIEHVTFLGEGYVERGIRGRHRLLHLAFRLIYWSGRILTLGGVDLSLSDFVIVLRKT